MKKTNIFDDVMDYIDENIKCKYADVKNGIRNKFTYNDMDFNKFLSITTRGTTTLNRYFIRRRLYFVSKELVNKPDVPITNIAYEFNYSEQSSLNRDKKPHLCSILLQAIFSENMMKYTVNMKSRTCEYRYGFSIISYYMIILSASHPKVRFSSYCFGVFPEFLYQGQDKL